MTNLRTLSLRDKYLLLINSRFLQQYFPYILICIVTLLLCLPLLSAGVPGGDDFMFHVYRYKGFIAALSDGQPLPQVDPNAAYGFGHSWNIFYGPLITYCIGILYAITQSWPLAINIAVLLSIFMSGIFMYRYLNEISGLRTAGLIGALLYMTAPYHLLDIYLRQAHGEIFAFIFIPLVFHGLWRIIHKFQKSGNVLLVTGAVGLLLTHNLSALLVAIFAFLYLAINLRAVIKQWKYILGSLLFCLGLTLGLAAFFLIPLLEVKSVGIYNIFDPSYTATGMGINGMYLNSWRMDFIDLIQNPTTVTEFSDTKPFSIGIIAIIGLLLLPLTYRFIPKTNRLLVIGFFIFALASLALTTKIIDWSILPDILLSIQFPWRFLFIASFFTSIIGAFSYTYFTRKLLSHFHVNLIFSTLSYSLLVTTIIGVSLVTSNSIINNNTPRWMGAYSYENLNGTGGGEYLPATSSLDDKQELERNIQSYLKSHGKKPSVNHSDISINDYKENGTHASFKIKAKNQSGHIISLPYIYYPGYKAEYRDQFNNKRTLETLPSNTGLLSIVYDGEINGKITIHYGLSGGSVAGLSVTVFAILISIANLPAFKQFRKRLNGMIGLIWQKILN